MEVVYEARMGGKGDGEDERKEMIIAGVCKGKLVCSMVLLIALLWFRLF